MVAALFTLAACGGSDDSASGGSPDPSGLAAMSVGDAGSVLVDEDGLPVYINDAEAGGMIKCVDGCLDFWPPVVADGDKPTSVEGVDGTFGITTRPDGTAQVTLDDQPLYTFVQDEGGDVVKGNGFEDDFQGSHFVWHVVTASDGATPSDDGDDNGGGYGGY